MKYLVSKPAYGFDLIFFRRTAGNKNWHHIYRKPYVGAGLHYMNFGNPTLLGQAVSGYAFIDFYVNRNKNSGFIYHWGEGIAYITKPFESETNNLNIAVGSHINVFIDLSFGYIWTLRNGIMLKPSLSFTHYSNGSFKKPNLGINIINAKLAINLKTFPTKNNKSDVYAPKKEERKYEFQTFFMAGLHQKDPPMSPVYEVYSLRGQSNYKFSNKHAVGLGIDIFNDHAWRITKQNHPHRLICCL
jgi:hypothetical protein